MERPIINDDFFMRQAIQQARYALDMGEVPIGAIIVCNGIVVGRGHNMVETLADATAHAELQAITAATSSIGGKYLKDCTLYVTLEPCPMCAGACYWSQLGRVVYGAEDVKRGYRRTNETMLHPKTKITFGILKEECAELLDSFFSKLRH